MKKFILTALLVLMTTPAFAATTYYIKTSGGSATQCDGTHDAALSGATDSGDAGTLPDCAYSHPYWALSPEGNNPTKMVGGDTMIIDGASSAKYQMGYGAPNTATCNFNWPYECRMRPIPSGTTAAPTKILGKGYDSGCSAPPQLWGTERSQYVVNLTGSNNVEVQCLEITDHSACQEFGPTPCNRDTYPFGAWAVEGIRASDSSNVLLKNLNIHGLRRGVYAGRLNNWTIDHVYIVGNSFVGWDGDIGANISSNSGTMRFSYVTIRYNGCGETYPGNLPYDCYSQSQGGYGDGIGTHKTAGNWIFDHCDVSRNVSDGVDMAYHDGNGTITSSNGTYKENAGSQFKDSNANMTFANDAFDGNCSYFDGNSIARQTFNGFPFDNCRAFGDTISAGFGKSGMQVRITNSVFTNVEGNTALLSSGSACNGTEVFGVDTATTFQLLARFHSPTETASKYYASGTGGNGDGPCGALQLTTIASSCTSNGTCSAGTPACGTTTTGTDNCGNVCTKTGAACPVCVPNGTCTAANPACGQTTTGKDNCNNNCTKTGPACPTCTPDGSCTAPTPACGQVTTGKDNCGNNCSKTGAACPVCTPTSACSAPTPACGQTTSGFNNCGGACVKVGAACPACTPTVGVCSAPTPVCGSVTTGFDDCNNSCTKTGAACPACVSNGSCSAATPGCNQTKTGTDNCGTVCTKVGPVCCTPSVCNAPTPSCGQTTTGLNNCGGACSKIGTACCVSDDSCSAPTPACGQSTTGVDNCGKSCVKIGDPCPGYKTYNITYRQFRRQSLYYTSEVLAGNVVNFTHYDDGDFQITRYAPLSPPPSGLVYTISMEEFKRRHKFYISEILAGAKVYTLNYNGGSFEISQTPSD